jgi:hypothetical protein
MGGLTYEKRLAYAREMTRLGLWYARRLLRDGAPLREAVNRRTPLYRLTSLWDRTHHVARGWDDPAWETVLKELEAAHARSKTTCRFESQGADILAPLLEGGAQRDVAHWPWIPEGYCVTPLPDAHVFGFFAFETPEGGDCAAIHLANPFVPESPFSDPRARLRELGAMAAAIGRLAPGARRLGCASWLNAFPPFLALMPPEWAASLEPRPARGVGFDLWGQFVARDGGFHARNGRRFRQTGAFPYPVLAGCCTLEAVARHVETRANGAARRRGGDDVGRF